MSRLFVMVLLGGVALAQGPSASSSLAAIEANKNVAGSATVSKSVDLLPDLLPPVWGKPTIVGGTIRSLDHVRDKVVIRVFGGRDMVVLFDGRTQVYRDGKAATARDLQAGERIYADTMLAGTDIFASTIRILTQGPTGQSNGQLQSYDPASGELLLRDVLASEPTNFRLAPDAIVLRDGQTSSAAELRAGSLVSLKFAPSAKGPGVVREITIIAVPGGTFTFAGRVSHVDLHSGLLVLVDPRDQKTYEVDFDPATTHVDDGLHEGANVTVNTSFDGTRYKASNIVVNSAPGK